MLIRTTLATDSFDRADNADIGANWTQQTGHQAFKIVSNTAQPSGFSSNAAENYSGIPWPDDQWAQAACTTTGGVSAARGPGVALRMSSSAQTWYRCLINEDASANLCIRKFVNGVSSAITTFTTTYVDGGVFDVQVVDTTLSVSYQGVLLGTVIDSSIASGSAGINFSSSVTSCSVDNWSAGGFIEQPQILKRMFMGMGR